MPEKSIKNKARNFLTHLLEKPQKENLSDENPPPPPLPSKIEQYNPHTTSPFLQDPNLIPAFSNLSISPDRQNHHNPPTSASFIGGFKPSYPSSPIQPGTSSSLTNANASISTQNGRSSKPPPIAMPVPFATGSAPSPPHKHSLTMQMALQPPDLAQRPHSNPVPHTFASKPSTSTTSLPTKPPAKKPASSPSTPTKASARLSTSGAGTPGRSPSGTPAGTPNGKAGQEQCAGVTKAGKRCARMVKAHPALSAFDSSDEENSSSVPRFCHQHSKELMEPSGFYARQNGEWVKFADWIPDYLSADTKVSLRVEMEKSRSASDVPGYIYTFEIRDPKDREFIKLKVGRAVNLVKRIDQWGKQCGSKEQVLRGFYPGSVEPDEDGNEGSLMKGRVKAGEKGPWCHRLERLVHLELADLATTEIYLDPDWPNVAAPEPASNGSKAKDSNNAGPCVDCGSIHKEIFEFRRWGRGAKAGKEWEQVVKPVIERWGKFVELYL